jgi:type VI protein secretion system component VasK
VGGEMGDRGQLAPAAAAIGRDPGKGAHVFNNNGSFLLALFEFFIFFAWFMCLFWVFGDLFRSRDLGGGAKTVWVLFIIILPILGMLVYLIARGHGMTERGLAAQAEAQKRQDEYIRSVAGSNAASGSAADQIASAKTLLDSGAINQGEFDQIKAKALATAGA